MRIKMIVEYDGTDFHGFQRQPSQRTVDQTLEEAVYKVTGQECRILGAGRTDAGVHALGQVVAFDTGSGMPPERFARALNGCLPPDVAVISSELANDTFHPRFDARAKTYRYQIYCGQSGYTLMRRAAWQVNDPLNIADLHEAMACLIGTNDYRAFMASGSDVTDCVRTISDFTVRMEEQCYLFEITANGFLYHMVRNLIGTLVPIGRGLLPPESMAEILESGDRRNAGPTAPACGLCLMRVFY